MQILSATQAIGPAWNHTRDLLLRPRRWQLLLKIGAVAVFAQLGGGSFNANFPSGGHNPALPPALAGMMLAFILLFVFFGLILGVLMFYVGSRLQFVLFDVVLRRDTRVGPIWTRFGRVTWPWIGLKLLVFLLLFLCLLPVVVPAVFCAIKLAHHGGFQHPNLAVLVPVILGFVGFIFLFVLFFTSVLYMLYDFGLPSMALEATPIRETVRRIVALLRLETKQVILYLLLRLGLGIAGVLAAESALILTAIVAFAAFGGVGFGLWAGLHNSGIAARVFMGLGIGVLGLTFLVLFVIAAISVLGYVYTFLQAYAIYFLAGRYPLMGEMLDRYTPVVPPPPYPPLYQPPA